MYRNMLITRAIEERGHILYKQGKIPGSFYTAAATRGRRRAWRPRWGRTTCTCSSATWCARDAGRRGLARLCAVHGRGEAPPGAATGTSTWATRGWGSTRWSATCRRCSRSPSAWASPSGSGRGERVAVAWCGEEPPREDAHEGMNLAGVRRLPVVFVIDNNQWAYSTPSHRVRRRPPRRPRSRLRLRRRGRRQDRCSPSTGRRSARSRRRAREVGRR